MADSNYTGEWFLPGSDKKYPGRIIINKKKKIVQLQIFGNSGIEGAEVTNGLEANPGHFYEYILGVCQFAEKVTLYNCHLRKVSHLGKQFAKIVYEVDFMFTGVHVNNTNELTIESGTFIFPYLASWYDGSKSIDALHGGRTGVYFSDDKELEHKLNNPKPEPEYLAITENLTLVFWHRIDKRMKQINVHHEVKYQKYISFNYKSPVPFKQLLKDASVFGRLLSFSISEPLYYELISVRMPNEFMATQKSMMDHFTYAEIYVSSFELSKGKKVDHHSLHQNGQVISNWTFSKEELNKIIVKWFSNTHLFHVYDYYNDSNNWFQGSEVILSNVMFNNRFLNIIQGLEDYYRKTIEDKKRDVLAFNEKKQKVLAAVQNTDLKSWLNKSLRPPRQMGLEGKLSSLIHRFKDIIDELFINKEIISLFPGQGTIRRHRLSHGNTKSTSQGIELELYFYFGRVLLAICILESLNISDIAKRIERCHRLYTKIHFLNSIKLVVKKSSTQ